MILANETIEDDKEAKNCQLSTVNCQLENIPYIESLILAQDERWRRA